MIGWHHQLNGHEFEQTPQDSGGQRSLVDCSPWGCEESDTTGPILCDPIDYTVHGILQARILEWVAFPFSRGSSQSRD